MDRTVNPGLATYMKAVDTAVLQACGVTYGEIYRDLHGDLSGMKESYDSGKAASDFVDRVINEGKLVLLTDPDLGASARTVNMRRASLVAYAAENPEWLLGSDRSLFSANDDGELFRLSPVRSRDGQGWGFAVEKVLSGAPSVDDSGMVTLPEGAESERLGAGLDIEDAIAAYEARLAPSAPGLN